MPAADGGPVTVRAARTGIRFRLVGGPEAVFRLSGPDGIPSGPGEDSGRWALLPVVLDGPGSARTSQQLQARRDGDCWRFVGFPPGTYAVFVYLPGYLPIRIPEVALGDGTTDLGAHVLRRGSAVRVRILPKEGEATPRIHVEAVRTGGSPAYLPWTDSIAGETEVILTGILPGRWRVTVWTWPTGTGAPRGNVQRQEVEVPPHADVIVEYDLRGD